MERNEKLLLLQLILEDIRGNWGFELEPRVEKALNLAEDLELPIFIANIKEYQVDCANGDNDGRFFRTSYKSGGYCDMEEMHNLSPTIINRSKEFKESINILTYPECSFTDWDKWPDKY